MLLMFPDLFCDWMGTDLGMESIRLWKNFFFFGQVNNSTWFEGQLQLTIHWFF